jgi:hypothetical protein
MSSARRGAGVHTGLRKAPPHANPRSPSRWVSALLRRILQFGGWLRPAVFFYLQAKNFGWQRVGCSMCESFGNKSKIAKIGVLLERFSSASYDYRLFM